ADVEGAHERLFFETLGRIAGHSGVEVPDVPSCGDRHVTRIGPAVDEDEAILAKLSVGAGIVDKARNEEFLLGSRCQITLECGAIVELGEPDARMRAART